MYNFRVVSFNNGEASYNFQAKSYRRKDNKVDIMGIQDTIDKDQCSTMTLDFSREPHTRVYVMNYDGKTIDTIMKNK